MSEMSSRMGHQCFLGKALSPAMAPKLGPPKHKFGAALFWDPNSDQFSSGPLISWPAKCGIHLSVTPLLLRPPPTTLVPRCARCRPRPTRTPSGQGVGPRRGLPSPPRSWQLLIPASTASSAVARPTRAAALGASTSPACRPPPRRCRPPGGTSAAARRQSASRWVLVASLATEGGMLSCILETIFIYQLHL
jgi:hypothetical protein